MEYINGKDLYQMFNYGTYYITKERKHLNDINVFPVADGDTGNNLLQTFKSILQGSEIEHSFSKALKSISNSVLMGARGNSGIIFAQFVNGLQKASIDADKISLEDFSILVKSSYEHTYASIINPVEGTIITIIKEWGNLLAKFSAVHKSIKKVFESTLISLKKTLTKTKTMMALLAENDVVDSGALGFILFVEGIVSYYNQDKLELLNFEDVKISDKHLYNKTNYRYCTEGLVKYIDFDENKIRNDLNTYGDSLVIAKGQSRFRVHIHTNTPEKVFEALKFHGHIETQKIGDMQLELNLEKTSKKRVLVTDSIADIPKEYLDQNQIVVIPMNINIDSVSYLDKLSINNSILFRNLDSYLEYPKTSTPSISYVNDLFSKLLVKFDEVIVLTVSKELSGTHNLIKTESDILTTNEKKIYVIDSYNNSATEGLLVKKTLELLNKDVPSLEIVKKIEALRNKTQILVCLETFKYATMSGRLPKMVGKIGMFFKLRPIMSLEKGKGSAFGIALSKKGITKKILKLVKKDMEKTGIESYSIVHCKNKELAIEYSDLFTKVIGKKPEFITEISSATAIHSGVGSVAIGYIKK